MELRNWSITNFQSEERFIEAPDDKYIAIVDGHLENNTADKTTVYFRVYTYNDILKFEIPYEISGDRRRQITGKIFIRDREYLSVEAETNESVSPETADVDLVLFGTEAPLDELDPPEAWEWLGEWDDCTTYLPNNIVKAPNGSLYIAIYSNQGEQPTESNENWELFTPTIGVWRGEWSESETYYRNHIVRYADNNLYRANKDEVTSTPGNENDDWEVFLENLAALWQGEWDASTQYYPSEIVRGLDGHTYIANVENFNSEPATDNPDWDLFIERAEGNATSIQGNNVTTDAPSDGDALLWNDSQNQFIYGRPHPNTQNKQTSVLQVSDDGTEAEWGSGYNWIIKNDSNNGDEISTEYKILGDTSNNPFSLDMPSNPDDKQTHLFLDYKGTWGSSYLTLYGNGNTIEGDDALTLDVSKGFCMLVFHQNDSDWKVRAVS